MRWKILLLLVLALACSPGCAIKPGFGAEARKVSLGWSAPVAVSAARTARPDAPFNVGGSIRKAKLDDQSDAMAELLRATLEESGATVAPGGKTLEVEVVHMDLLFGGPCVIDVTTRLGDGAVFGVQSQRDDCKDAFEDAATRILGHERTYRYLGGR